MTKFSKIIRVEAITALSILILGLISSLNLKGKEFNIPQNIDSSFKCFEDGKFITDTSSKQFQIVHSAPTIVGNHGIYNRNNRYLVAMSRRYGKIGDNITIKLKSGTILNVTIGDYKKTAETLDIGYGMHKISNTKNCLLEFIVSEKKINRKVKILGDLSLIYPGNIVKIINPNM